MQPCHHDSAWWYLRLVLRWVASAPIDKDITPRYCIPVLGSSNQLSEIPNLYESIFRGVQRVNSN